MRKKGKEGYNDSADVKVTSTESNQCFPLDWLLGVAAGGGGGLSRMDGFKLCFTTAPVQSKLALSGRNTSFSALN